MQQSIILDIRDFLELAQLPQWLLYFGVPALLLLSGLILAIVHADRAFPPVALFLGAVGLVLVASIAETLGDFMVWAALYLAVAALTRLLFLIPFPKKKQKDRDEDIYAAFQQLAHVDSLIGSLREKELAPADRLELDAVVRTLEDCRGRALTAAEQRTLNDCLSSVLKLSAKYSL